MTPEEQAIEIAKETVKQVLLPVQEIVRQVAGPSAAEVGLMFGDAVRAWRFKNAVRLLENVKRVASESHLELKPVAPRLLFPILDAATLNEDEDLHARWVALLANAATTGDVLPSFPEILRQLTPEEARFLEFAFYQVNRDEESRSIQKRIQILSGFPFLEHPIQEKLLESIQPIMLDNLLRLMVLRRDSGIFSAIHEEASTSYEGELSKEFDNAVYLTQFGRAFIRACRLPNSPTFELA